MQEVGGDYNPLEKEAPALSNGETHFAPSPAGEEPTDGNRDGGGAPPGSDAGASVRMGESIAAQMTGHAIIAGYGLPGRAVAEALEGANIPFCVIERNLEVVSRCARGGVTIIEGDASSEAALLAAGIARAWLFAVTIPSDANVLEAVGLARRLNPSIRILARCEYLSSGLKASRRGADDVVVAEQAVATEFGRLVRSAVASPTPGAPS
jgi:voltage-gated potassium channel Kch